MYGYLYGKETIQEICYPSHNQLFSTAATKNPGKQRIKALDTMTTNDSRFHEGPHEIVASEPKIKCCKECSSQTVYMCKKCEVYLYVKCSCTHIPQSKVENKCWI